MWLSPSSENFLRSRLSDNEVIKENSLWQILQILWQERQNPLKIKGF